MTFDDVLGPRHTAEERDALAWHLGMIRFKQTYEALRCAPKSDASPTAAMTDAIAARDREDVKP